MTNPSALKDFQKTQLAFTAHIRDPEGVAKPSDIEDRRMGIYRELLYNNVVGFINQGFPVIRTLFCEDDWNAICRDFFKRHKSHTPYFKAIGEEFIGYLTEELPAEFQKPFLAELAHYEYMEVVAEFADVEVPQQDDDVNWLEVTIAVSGAAFALAYQFPVHTITVDEQPTSAPEHTTHLVVYRDSKDDVGFMEINPVTARLLQLIQSGESNGEALLARIAEELNHPDTQAVIKGGISTLQSLYERNIIHVS